MATTRKSRVEPALTRREWEKVRTDSPLWEPTTAHVDMALSNAKLPDGDPRKLTHLQAINLRAAAAFFETAMMPGPETRAQLVDVLRATTDAIEAILPPPPQRRR